MKKKLQKRLWLLLIILLVMTFSVDNVFSAFEFTVEEDGTISNAQSETSKEESVSVSGWHGKNGMTVVENGSEITVSGLQDGLVAFAAVGLGGKKIEPGKHYIFEAYMKVEELSPPISGPFFKVAVKNTQTNAFKSHSSDKYVITNIGQWQKLSVEFTGDENESFSYINLEKGSKKAISAKIFLKDISLIMSEASQEESVTETSQEESVTETSQEESVTETSQEESVSVSGWHGKNGMTVVENGSEITVSGLQDGLVAFAAVGLGGKKIEPGKHYIFEAYMKVEELSPPISGPFFKVAVKNTQTNAFKSHSSDKYVITNIGQWQKLSVEFTGDENESFSYINLEKGSKKAISAKIFLKDISLTIKDNGDVTLDAITIPMVEEKVDYVTIPVPEKTFNKSAVFGYGRAESIDLYKEYNIDFVPWGGTFYPQHIEYYQTHLIDAQKVGTVISAKVGFRTNWQGFIDFAGDQALEARLYDISDNPIELPFRSGKSYKGFPPYYFDANHDLFVNFIKNNIDLAMSNGADGLFVDDPFGTSAAVLWGGAGYGKRNSDIFKNYLQSHFTQSQLSLMGIGDIEHFSLKDFHGGYSFVEPSKRPLFELIADCFLHESLNTFKKISDYARNKNSKSIAVGANIFLPNKSIPQILYELDYSAPEIKMGASSGRLDNSENGSLFAFKSADSLRRPVAIMGSGYDHGYIKKYDLPGMVRGWIAEAYAHGNYFLAPYRLWAIDTDGVSTSHYEPSDHKMFSSLYAFVKDHSELFDGYECDAKVGIINSFEDYQKDSSPVKKLTDEISRQNIDFDLIVAGNEALAVKIDTKKLMQYKYVVLPPNAALSGVDQKTMEQYFQTGKVIKDIDEIGSEVKIDLPGENMVRATMRKHSIDKNKPYVLHLLNRDYDMAADSCRVKKNFTINIPDSLVEYGKITKVVLHQPLSLQNKKIGLGARGYSDNPTKEINSSYWNNGVTLSIPELDLWGVVVIYVIPPVSG